jgi:hypothetical protein
VRVPSSGVVATPGTTNAPAVEVVTAARAVPLDGVTTTLTPESDPPRLLVTAPATVPVGAGPVLEEER